MSLDAIWAKTAVARKQARIERGVARVHAAVVEKLPPVKPVERPAVTLAELLGRPMAAR